MSITIENLKSALAGESQAHIKYRYFARIAREEGHEDVAKHFEHTADQELLHAWGHLELLINKPSTRECLEMAIAGETEEFTYMYPRMATAALNEGNTDTSNWLGDWEGDWEGDENTSRNGASDSNTGKL
jgi:rubrerythrin